MKDVVSESLNESGEIERTDSSSTPAPKEGTNTGESAIQSQPSANTEDDGDEAGDSDDQPASDEQGRRKNGWQKRVDKLTKRLSDRDREIDYWRQKAMSSPHPQETQAQQSPAAPSKPKADQFENYEDYVEALTDWKVGEARKQVSQESEQRSVEENFAKKASSHNERIEALKSSDPSFAEELSEFLEDHRGLNVSNDLAEIVMDSDLSAQVMRELIRDPQKLIELNRMSPRAAAREVGRIESRIESRGEPQAQKPKPNPLPPPVTPISQGTGTTRGLKDVNEMSADEYMAWRRKQRNA